MWLLVGFILVAIGMWLLVKLFKLRDDADSSFMLLSIAFIGLIIVVGGMFIQANIFHFF